MSPATMDLVIRLGVQALDVALRMADEAGDAEALADIAHARDRIQRAGDSIRARLKRRQLKQNAAGE